MNPELEKVLLKVQKPGRYAGGESNRVVKDQEQVDVRFAFCFPDVYEVGMSHLGMKILYGLFNEMDGVWCERVFAPWPDMEEQMREHQIPLYGLESGDAITNFDFIGFTLQYELQAAPVPATVSLWPIFWTWCFWERAKRWTGRSSSYIGTAKRRERPGRNFWLPRRESREYMCPPYTRWIIMRMAR